MTDSRDTFDVAVIGGGSAGLAAAITAAREGARTVLIERYGFLGGMGTASLVHTFCGLYLIRDEPGAVLANPGFSAEMAARMIAATGMGPQRMGRLDVLFQHPVEFARIADEMVRAEPKLECRLHTELIGVEQTAKGWKLALAGRGGRRELTAAAMVDASGDAVVADFLETTTEIVESPRLQRPAYVFGIHGTGPIAAEDRLRLAGLLVRGVREGKLPAAVLGISFRESGRPGEVFAGIDLNLEGYDPLDAQCLTELEMTGRSLAAAAVDWFKQEAEGWEHAYISQWPLRVGVRESRRWIGERTLTGGDLIQGVRFADEIGLATWPMEFRETAKGPKFRFPVENRPTGIPLGCLKPRGIERLFVAGRCISTDHEAQASIRVMGTCFVTGEAAGRAAACSVGL
ncbi:MAG: FAD-dependent oxidoreductase [Luteolibacter sp.]